MPKTLLFVCLGNICRSPMAEAIFKTLLKKYNLTEKYVIDSAAIIDYHLGKSPDQRTMKTLNDHDITSYAHRVRQVGSEDFAKFDFIFGMDEDNMGDLESVRKLASNSKAKVQLLGKYDPGGEIYIEDPYYVFLGQNRVMNNPLIMYVIMRRDLLAVLKWPLGACMAQACHASSAILWCRKDDTEVADYMKEMDSMRKVVLEVENETDLRKLSEHLGENEIFHKLWIENPEKIATCIAVRPYPKKTVHKYLKHLPLFS